MKTNFSLRSNVSAVTHDLLKSLSVKVNFHTIELLLSSHPEEGSLLAIVDCLAELHIQTDIYNIPSEDYSRDDLIYPFVAHLKDGDKFIAIKSFSGDSFVYGDENGAKHQITESQFLLDWSGVALTAVVEQTSGEQAYLQNKIGFLLTRLLYPAAALFFFLILMNMLYFTHQPPPVWLAAAFRVIGAALSALLIGKTFHVSNGILDKVCSISGDQGCDELLFSPAGKITSWLSWSEAGFFYFSGSLLYVLISPGQLFYVALLNALSVPLSLYLLSFQVRNKTWCVVCCMIQAVVLLQFGADFMLGNFNSGAVSLNSLVLISCFAAPILLWAVIRPLIEKAGDVNYFRYHFNQLKFDPEIFQKLLESQPHMGNSEDLVPLRFGNPEAKHMVTVVTNPNCSSCAEVHDTIFNWLNLKRDICIQIMFATSDLQPDARRVASCITALYQYKGAELAEEAMTAWFNKSGGSLYEWEKLYSMEDLASAQQTVLKQKSWCQDQRIEYTPVLYINGHILPKQYTPVDLKYIIG